MGRWHLQQELLLHTSDYSGGLVGILVQTLAVGGYVAQRMMSAKDEKHSLFATLWFTVAHYTIRPWLWIIVTLVALVILPRSQNTDIIKAENPALYEKVVESYNNNDLLISNNPVAHSFSQPTLAS